MTASFLHSALVCFSLFFLGCQSNTATDAEKTPIDRNHPFIFVGGMPRSGTTLMRAMLDVHSSVRCGMETRVIPRLLDLHHQLMASPPEIERLKAIGVYGKTLDDAVAAFIMKIIAAHGAVKPRLCAKDPYLIMDVDYLTQLFPNSKFIFMIRDGRAFVHSLLKMNVSINGFDEGHLASLERWDQQIEQAHERCENVGPLRCLGVRYEDLILDTKQWLGKITAFLDIPLEPQMLEPWKQVHKEVKVSETEYSTSQISQPIYLDSLDEWVREMPANFTEEAGKVAPMLAKLKYDVTNIPPQYGTPSPEVWQDGKYNPHREHTEL